jgi:hypothetical protein
MGRLRALCSHRVADPGGLDEGGVKTSSQQTRRRPNWRERYEYCNQESISLDSNCDLYHSRAGVGGHYRYQSPAPRTAVLSPVSSTSTWLACLSIHPIPCRARPTSLTASKIVNQQLQDEVTHHISKPLSTLLLGTSPEDLRAMPNKVACTARSTAQVQSHLPMTSLPSRFEGAGGCEPPTRSLNQLSLEDTKHTSTRSTRSTRSIRNTKWYSNIEVQFTSPGLRVVLPRRQRLSVGTRVDQMSSAGPNCIVWIACSSRINAVLVQQCKGRCAERHARRDREDTVEGKVYQNIARTMPEHCQNSGRIVPEHVRTAVEQRQNRLDSEHNQSNSRGCCC